MRALSLIALLLSLLLVTSVMAAEQNVAKTSPCKYCGMDRNKLAHSRMLLTYEDGSEVETCSLHCIAVDLVNKDNINRVPVKIMVGDYNSKTMIDAEKAYWVLGGSKPGVMTNRAKWAFADRSSAEVYVSANGGTIITFEQALKAAYEDMYEDTRAIREKRKMMRLKTMGEKKEGAK